MSSPWLPPRAPAEPPALPTVAWTADAGLGAHGRHVRGHLAVGRAGRWGRRLGPRLLSPLNGDDGAAVDRAAARVVGRPVQVGRKGGGRDGTDLARVPPDRRRAEAAVGERASRAPPGPAARAACPAGRAGPRPGASPGGRRRDAAPPGCRLGWAARRRPDGRPPGRRRSSAPSGPREGARRPGCRWRRVGRAGGRRGVGAAAGTVPVATEARREATLRGAGSGAAGGAAAVAGSSAMRLSPLRAGRGPGSGTGVGISPVRSPASQPARCDWLSGGAGEVGHGRRHRRRAAPSSGAARSSRGAMAADAAAGRGRSDSVTSTTPSSTRSRTARDTPSSVSPRRRGQLAHGAPRGHGDERLPAVGADRHLVGRQVAGERDLVLERRNDGLELVPLAEQGVGPAQQRLDVLGLAAGGGGVVAVEGEVARLEPQQLEHDLVDGRAVERAVGVGVDHATLGQPHVAPPTIAVDPEPTGLRRRRQQAQDIGERECVESPLQRQRCTSGVDRPAKFPSVRSHQPRPPVTRAPSVGPTTTRRGGGDTQRCNVVSRVTNYRRTSARRASSCADRGGHLSERRGLAGPAGEGVRGLVHQHPDAVHRHRAPVRAPPRAAVSRRGGRSGRRRPGRHAAGRGRAAGRPPAGPPAIPRDVALTTSSAVGDIAVIPDPAHGTGQLGRLAAPGRATG